MTFTTSTFDLEAYQPAARILRIVLDRNSGRYNSSLTVVAGDAARQIPGTVRLSAASLDAIRAFAEDDALMTLRNEDLYEFGIIDDCAWALEIFADGRHLEIDGSGACFAAGELPLHTTPEDDFPVVKTGFENISKDVEGFLGGWQ